MAHLVHSFTIISIVKNFNILILFTPQTNLQTKLLLVFFSIFEDIRRQFMVSINEFNQYFRNLPIQEQFTQIMSNSLYYKIVSKAMHSILYMKHIKMYL